MASLSLTPSGVFYLAFRYEGDRFNRSLETSDEKDAREQKAIVERTLKHLKQSVLRIAEGTSSDQLWQFLRSGGKQVATPRVVRSIRLNALCKKYLASFADSAKEATTLDTEGYHLNHFQRLMGKGTALESIGPATIQKYMEKRQREQGIHGGRIKPVTIGKELQTFRQLWQFAEVHSLVKGDNPVNGVKKPRGSQKPPFKTWEEIKRKIQRGGLTKVEIAELWECLFLRENEIGALLQQVKERTVTLPRFPYIFPALAFCAYTGARRSEMFRCHIDDVNGSVLLREKKRSQDQRITFRSVPLHPSLELILSDWLGNHPGGQFMFCKNNENALDDRTSREALKAAIKGTKWSVLRGYHVLRHSFCSNLARHGVDQRKIDSFLGHQTDEQRERYRHLFPEDREAAITVLNY